MKYLFLTAIMLVCLFLSCNFNTKNTGEEGIKSMQTTDTLSVNHEEASHEHNHNGVHDELKTKSKTATSEGKQTTIDTSPSPQSTFSIKEMISSYLIMKSALTNDDAKGAAKAGKSIVMVMAKLSVDGLSAEQKKAYKDVADDIKENAEHIGDNAGKIEHQREHFAWLSKDVNDLIKMFGAGQRLYQDFCPMYNNGKGAIWISESKDIKNPYYGQKMLGCGKMKKEL